MYTISTDKSRLDTEMIHRFLSEDAYWARNIPREVVERSIENSICFGAFDSNRQVGFARVITDRATFAYVGDVFVLPSHRGHGIGTALVARASEHARNRRTMRLYMHCLAENAAMMTIARRTGMSIVINAGEADAHLALPPASPASVTRECFSDQLALIDYAQKAHIDALRRAADAVGKQ